METSTCSFDLFRALWPERVNAFRAHLYRTNQAEEVFGDEGEGLSLWQFYEALTTSVPKAVIDVYTNITESLLSSLLLDYKGNGYLLVNYEESVDEDGDSTGHWALLMQGQEKGTYQLFSPGYHGEARYEQLSARDLVARINTRDFVVGDIRGIIGVSTV